MPSTEEQRRDVIENCDYLLSEILAPFDETDDTPEGRMITQIKWFKERAENNDLSLPVDRTYTSTLRYVYTNGELLQHASSDEKAHEEIEIYLGRLMSLVRDGHLLIRPKYHIYALRIADIVLAGLQQPNIQDNKTIQKLTRDIKQLQLMITNQELLMPVGSYMPSYESFIYAEEILENFDSVLKPFEIFQNYVFNGVRPDTWLTPEDADKETKGLIAEI